MKQKRLIISILLAITLIVTLIPAAAFAETVIEFDTNGAANRYGQGSELLLLGKVTDSSHVLANVEVTATVSAGGEEIHYAKLTTDSQGFFRTRISIPKSAVSPLTIKIDAAGATKTWTKEFSTPSYLEATAFIDCVGYREGETKITTPSGVKRLGILFSANVNYYNNRLSSLTEDSSLGLNERNRDCFTFYKQGADGAFTQTGSSVDLVSSDPAGGNAVIDASRISWFPGKKPETIGPNAGGQGRKDTIFIDLSEALQPGVTYKLVIDGRLSANSSDTLGADEVFYFTAANVSGGSSGGSSSSAGGTGTPAVNTNLTPDVKDNKATITVQTEKISAAVTAALEEAEESGAAPVIQFTVSPPADSTEKINAVEVTIPQAAIKEITEAGVTAVISSPLADIALDSAVFSTIAGKDATLTAGIVDPADIPEQAKELLGDRPVYNFTLTSGGSIILDLGGTATVTIPYTLREGEDPNNIVVNYMDANGNLIMIPNCTYVNGKVTFTTGHFSLYAIVHNETDFADVIAGTWYKPSIDFVAARRLFVGVGNDMFAPQETMTRAMFITVLSNLDGAAPAQYNYSSFTDVNMNAWYGHTVAWGEAKGIVEPGASFLPADPITREDMAVMLYNYARVSRQNLSADQVLTFTDADEISGGALDAVAALSAINVINSNTLGQFLPKGKATRAEVAAILCNYIKAVVK